LAFRINLFAARLATGIRCEGRAYYLPISARQHLLQNFFGVRFGAGFNALESVA
jgi:hypothetical protein